VCLWTGSPCEAADTPKDKCNRTTVYICTWNDYKLAKANLERWKGEMIRNKAFWNCFCVLLWQCLFVPVHRHRKNSPLPPGVFLLRQGGHSKSIPIQMNAMGSVEPFQTISVRSQITAQIRKVLFREGQEVKTETSCLNLTAVPMRPRLNRRRPISTGTRPRRNTLRTRQHVMRSL